jgi:hypothetical protein
MTLQEFYEKTLQKMQVTAAGESAAPEDTELVSDRYVSLYEMLNAEKLVSWPVTADIPDRVTLPLIAMLAAHCAREFGIVGQAYAGLIAEGGIALPGGMSSAEKQLRRIQAKDYVPTRAVSEYF